MANANFTSGRMQINRLLTILALVLLCASVARISRAADIRAGKPPATQSATRPATMPATQPAAVPPPPIAPNQVATQSEALLIQLRNTEAELLASPVVQSIEDELPGLTTEIDNRLEETDKTLSTHASVQSLRTLQAQWESTRATLAEWRSQLAARSKQFKFELDQLNPIEADWQKTLDWAQKVHASPEISNAVNSALANIERTRRELQGRQKQIWAISRHVDAQDARVVEVLASVQRAREQALSRLLVRDSPPIWEAFRKNASSEPAGQNDFSRQFSALRSYIQNHAERLGIHAGVLIVCCALVEWLRRRLGARAAEDPELKRAMAIFQRPLATATVLSFVASIWIYPDAPQLLLAFIAALALVPTVLLLRRLVDRRLLGLLNVLIVLFFIDQIRSVLVAQPLLYRLLVLAEMGGTAAFLAIFLRASLSSSDPDEKPGKRWIAGRLAARIVIGLFCFAFVADVLGYCALANLLNDATLSSAYLGLIFYAGTRIASGLVIFALRAWPLNRAYLVRRHEALLLPRITIVLGWLAAALWVYEALDLFNIRSATLDYAHRVLFSELTVGSISVSLGQVLAFALTILAAFWLSRFIRFVLQEDVFVRLDLPSGIPYAITRVLHYFILVWGFWIAVASLEPDMTKFTILASAFGVGLGFGMQTIVNNFVSGIILLFERPIKVGDVIQLGDTTGVVQHIGIRASIMLTPDGSEIIIPNGSLLSDRVTNWTLTSGRRAVLITINIAPGPDPNHVIELLKSTAKANAQILAAPGPEAFVTKFAPDSFTYELRAWTSKVQNWVALRSELTVAIYNAAVKDGLTLK
jgi:small-conductance mechanosensitive channel